MFMIGTLVEHKKSLLSMFETPLLHLDHLRGTMISNVIKYTVSIEIYHCESSAALRIKWYHCKSCVSPSSMVSLRNQWYHCDSSISPSSMVSL